MQQEGNFLLGVHAAKMQGTDPTCEARWVWWPSVVIWTRLARREAWSSVAPSFGPSFRLFEALIDQKATKCSANCRVSVQDGKFAIVFDGGKWF